MTGVLPKGPWLLCGWSRWIDFSIADGVAGGGVPRFSEAREVGDECEVY